MTGKQGDEIVGTGWLVGPLYASVASDRRDACAGVHTFGIWYRMFRENSSSWQTALRLQEGVLSQQGARVAGKKDGLNGKLLV